MTLLREPWPEVPALAEVYDIECSGRWDHDFYLDLAAELGATSVVDLGCGTGVFCVDAATRGVRAIGVDPAAAVLDIARNRPGGENVAWIQGGLDLIESNSVDLVILMGHVAQYFVNDADWANALNEIKRILVRGGHVAFETRNPRTSWAERWTKDATTTVYPHPSGGEFTSWVEVKSVEGPSDSYTITHEGNTILPDGRHLRVLETLRFRSPGEVFASLADAGLELVNTWGDWERMPFDADSHELIVLAGA